MTQPRKITDSSKWGSYWTRYSTVRAINCNNTLALVQETQHASVINLSTLDRTPLDRIGDSNAPKWDRKDPNRIWYHSGRKLLTYNFATGFTDLIQDFSEYTTIGDKGEADISEDGLHVVLIGDDSEVFVFNLQTRYKRIIGKFSGIDGLTITPDNDVIVSKNTGIFLYRKDEITPVLFTQRNGHKCCTRDSDGSQVMIWYDDTNATIEKIRLSKVTYTRLLKLDWSLAVHISCPDNAGFCLVETYDPLTPECKVPWGNAIIKVPLDGSAPTELLKHGAFAATDIQQPRVSVSANGGMLAYASNGGKADGPLDVYVAEMDTPPLPVPNGGEVAGESVGAALVRRTYTFVEFGNQDTLTKENCPAKPFEIGTVYVGADGMKHLIVNDGGNSFEVPMNRID